MTKLTRLSLVAAVAVAGLTNVNAASLEEAIKGVDVSGHFNYRYQDKDSSGAEVNTDNSLEVTVKAPVTDKVTAVIKIDNAPNNTQNAGKADLEIEDYYFSYVNEGTTVNVGQQNVPSRQLDGKQGDGFVAMQKVGGITLGAAFFGQTNVIANTKKDISTIIASGSVGPAAYTAQYLNIADHGNAYNALVSAKLGQVSLSASYGSVDLDADSNDYSTLKLVASTKIGVASIKAMYVETGDNGSGSIDADSDAAVELITYQYGTGGKSNAAVYAGSVTVPVMDKVTFTAFGLAGDNGTTATVTTQQDVTEVFGQLTYKPSNNLTTYVRVGNVELDNSSTDRARIDLKYTF